MAFKFEFDTTSRILITRFEGRITDQQLWQHRAELKHHATTTGATRVILDFSAVKEFAISTENLRELAFQKPNFEARIVVLVVPSQIGYGLARMFQILGERTRPYLTLARSLEEALIALQVDGSKFQPVEILPNRGDDIDQAS